MMIPKWHIALDFEQKVNFEFCFRESTELLETCWLE